MGGMEAHTHQLVDALVRRGHDVTLFASGDSDPALPLHAVADRHYEAVLPWALWHGTADLTAFQDAAFGRAWAAIVGSDFDIVHNNAMHPALHHWALRDGLPMVTSLHVPPFAGLARMVDICSASWLRQTATSHSHLQSWWTAPPASASVVHNGIDIDRWRYRPKGNGRAAWCGRITPNKGTAVAALAASVAELPIDLYGPVDCQTYFEDHVAPLLGADCVYHGHLGGPALIDAIGAASVLVATPMWDEPFGLVAAEAMACGVPVAAIDRGALREVIGNSGALSPSADPAALAEAIRLALLLPRELCRKRVAEHFSITKMIEGYEAAYAAAMAARPSSIARTAAVLA
ncbi:glycosyltransferase [Sphingomonas immobilis]|uniref:Glycosyltransferase n=1 Tax=Sphingomonas immobilis TaxID=3063997 RepID=A0ABT8ZZL6_9SPHN|nr:glycosyltransferase [Sphingomonas sp. CA1-15]MDO7841897.1 glycosyltransferase [Sphingomonas sp. CA1-15]